MASRNGIIPILSLGGVMDGANPGGIGGQTPINSSSFYVFGHSLFTYVGGDAAPETDYTIAGEWIGLLAQESGTAAGGAHTFGQYSNHNAQPWPNVGVNGTYDIGNTFNPTPNGAFPGHAFEHFITMPSNFLQADMGGPPYTEPTTTAQSEMETLIDNILAVYPSGEIFIYVHWPDAGFYSGAENMNAATFDAYNTATQGGYLDWHVSLQNALVAAGRPVRTIPVGPIIAWLFENEAYLSGLAFSDVYGDSAPHGSENIYFLSALICYRAIYMQNPSVASFTFPPAATQMRSEITSNVTTLVSQIDARLEYYNTLSGNSRVLVYPE